MPLPVTVRRETLTLPTYSPAAPDPNPMFLEKRVYQGSSGRVYPLPFIDRVAETPAPRAWDAVWLENEYLAVLILPEIGGRIHRMVDKTNGYDVVYHQTVIKPALVGLAGPWASGGIEFNWPQHHRPSTFMPATVAVEHGAEGEVTVWLSEHDPMARMKGMHGVCLRPGRAVLELRARVYNRTPDAQTFLWWANVATEVHGRYQSFFPGDASFVADHAKRAMSTFPRCSGRYYGVDYAARARDGVPPGERPRQFPPPDHCSADDLSWYANIPVPTSYMCMGTKQDFFGGYDHAAAAGIVHLADHRISPGKKQWTWGNHEFGYAWDRNLTDPDARGVHRPYIELMAGVYTDNQPDFSHLQPGETRTWTQRWYPIREIGPADQANADAAVSLRLAAGVARIGVSVTAAFPGARIVLSRRRDGRVVATFTRDLSPAAPFVTEVRIPGVRDVDRLTLTVLDANGVELLRHAPATPPALPSAEALAALAATEPPPPEEVAGADELYLTGLHLEQYRHATRCPTLYWNEALRRDPGDSRCLLALGRWRLRRGEFAAAEKHLTACIARLTRRNPNPADGEAYYQLGRTLRFLGRDAEAGEAFGKAAWNQAWASASHLALAEMEIAAARWPLALDHLERALRLDTDHLRARALRVMVLRRLQRTDEATRALAEAAALDPLDPWLGHLAGQGWAGDTQMRLDVAHDLARAGLFAEAVALLEAAAPEPHSGTAPLVAYTLGWLFERAGDRAAAHAARRKARRADPSYCFPARLEEIAVLESAIAADPGDARAPFFLAHLLYDRRRHREAIAHWETAVRLEPRNAVAWRCLGIGYLNILGRPARARAAYEHAVAAAPDDARLLYERDQLWKRLAVPPARRLRALRARPDLVARRDDLTVELCALLNQSGRPENARDLLAARRFQPWEGGEGLALGQHARAQLLLGRRALARGDSNEALTCFEQALVCPENLGEARHLLANRSEALFYLGEGRAAAGDRAGARAAWTEAANFQGDFQDMSVRAYSELTYFSALAWHRLGKPDRAERLLRDLLAYARALEKQVAKIDYFATSLPTLLLFEDDPQARQATTARTLQAQAWQGLGRKAKARAAWLDVLRRDPNHPRAGDALAELEKPGPDAIRRPRAGRR
jgi:tetratricopeptide (TPR) repeat protein